MIQGKFINFNLADLAQKQFIEFVLEKYVETGFEELGEDKLSTLLEIKYHSLEDAKEALGDNSKIRLLFMDFQKYLYQ